MITTLHRFPPESSLGNPREPRAVSTLEESLVVIARASKHNQHLYGNNHVFGTLARQIDKLLDEFRAMVVFVEDDSPHETLEQFLDDEYKLIRSWNLERNSNSFSNPEHRVPEEPAYFPLRSAALYAGVRIESLASTTDRLGKPALEHTINNVSNTPAFLAPAINYGHASGSGYHSAYENRNPYDSFGSDYGPPPPYQETHGTNYFARNSFDSQDKLVTSFAQDNYTLNYADFLDPRREEDVETQTDKEDQDPLTDKNDQDPLTDKDNQGHQAYQNYQGPQAAQNNQGSLADQNHQDPPADEKDQDSSEDESDEDPKANKKAKAPRKKKKGTKHHFVRDAPSINLHMPNPDDKGNDKKMPVNFTIVELMTFIPQVHRALWMINRIVWNGVPRSSLAHMIKGHRLNETAILDNPLLKSMQGEMQAKLGLAKLDDWTPGKHDELLENHNVEGKPANWEPNSISMAGYKIPAVANPDKERKATAGYMVGEDPIPFWRLGFNVRHWPVGHDALDLTRCVKHVLDFIDTCRHFMFPDDYFKVLKLVEGARRPTPYNADKACSDRWSGRPISERSKGNDPAWEAQCDAFLNRYGPLFGTPVPPQAGTSVAVQTHGQPLAPAPVPAVNVAAAAQATFPQAQTQDFTVQAAVPAQGQTMFNAQSPFDAPFPAFPQGRGQHRVPAQAPAPPNSRAPTNAQFPGGTQGFGPTRSYGGAFSSANLGDPMGFGWRPPVGTQVNRNDLPVPNHVTNHFHMNVHNGFSAPIFGDNFQGYGHTPELGSSSSGPQHGFTMGNAMNSHHYPDPARAHDVAPYGRPLTPLPPGYLNFTWNSGPSMSTHGPRNQPSMSTSGALFNGGVPGFTQRSASPGTLPQRPNTENQDDGKGKGKRMANDDVPPRHPRPRGGSPNE